MRSVWHSGRMTSRSAGGSFARSTRRSFLHCREAAVSLQSDADCVPDADAAALQKADCLVLLGACDLDDLVGKSLSPPRARVVVAKLKLARFVIRTFQVIQKIATHTA